MKKHILKTWIVCVLILSLTACNLPEGVDPNAPDFNLTITANAAAIETALASGQLPPEAQGLPATEDPALPPTEEIVIPAEVLPPAVGDVTVTVSVATNCRQGPGTAFKSIYGMPVGQVAKVVAKNSYSGYWIIEIPGQNGQTCWLWGQYATISGDTASLKDVVTPTSVSTNTPTATATLKATLTPTITSTSAVTGCTNPNATNYNPAASTDDGSCTYKTNKPTITNASVACEDQLDGNYKFTFTIDWLKNNTRSGLDYYITYQWKLADGTSMSYEEIPISTSPVIFSVIRPATWKLEVDFIIADTLGLTSGARSDPVQLTCP
ncbi:MAG: hypothetical protein J0M11_23280 [Anaerolineae bacterium]|nr:hypothetical protein [Anaerolineae bacterium]